MPIWAAVIMLVVGLVVWKIRSFYTRFRGVCRTVREELAEWVPNRFPGVSVTGEKLGNLVVRMEDGTERTWEMADVYTAVVQLPGMGADRIARARIYENAAQAFFNRGETGPLTPAHQARIKPRLVPQSALAELSSADPPLGMPLPDLGLVVVYKVEGTPHGQILTAAEAAGMGLDAEGVHRAALENLRRDFPADAVTAASREDKGGAFQMADGCNAARLLLVPEYLERDTEVIALLPHRDMLLLLPASLREDRAKLQEALAMLECLDHPPLLNHPVRVTPAGFSLL